MSDQDNLKTGIVSISDVPLGEHRGVYPAYVSEARLSGNLIPLFTKETILIMAGDFDTGENEGISYDNQEDSFTYKPMLARSSDDHQTYYGADIQVNGRSTRVYAFGESYWGWHLERVVSDQLLDPDVLNALMMGISMRQTLFEARVAVDKLDLGVLGQIPAVAQTLINVPGFAVTRAMDEFLFGERGQKTVTM